MQNLFLKEDHERVNTLVSEFDRYINLAKLELSKNNHDGAIKYTDHAMQMVTQIRVLKNLKQSHDEARKVRQQAVFQGLVDTKIQQRRL